MGEVWGTFSVKDHLRDDAFVREVLLFDRLVIPYPADAREWDRWRAPNPNDPTETWDPNRLDELLHILGTQRNPSGGQDPLVWQVDWSDDRWPASRRVMADQITDFDAFYTTRTILSMDESLPKVIEAIAAYPSEKDWAAENAPSQVTPHNLEVSSAILAITCPLLMPDTTGRDPLEVLAAAADLARDADFRNERDAFYQWIRAYLTPLQTPGTAVQTLVDAGSVDVMQHRLRQLLEAQRAVVKRRGVASWWDRFGSVCVAVTAAAGLVAAAVAAPPVAAALGLAAAPASLMGAGSGAAASAVGLAGWIASRQAQLPAPRPLDGASMFATAADRLGYELPRL